MSAFRKNPVFTAAMTACVLLVLAAAAVIGWRWWTARRLTREIAQISVQLAGLREVTPPPTREIADAVAADLARAERALEVMQAELKGKGPSLERLRAAKVPTARPDAYFDLAQFVERMRELAKKNEVEVRPEAARFGFAEHAHEAPRDEALLEPVFRQRQVAQYVLEALFEARPRALLAVKREAPLTKQQREQLAAAAAANPGAEAPAEAAPAAEGPDFFVLPPEASVRKPGFVDATAFRFVFTGQTAALRAFLNRLGAFELPVLLREIEVEPASADDLNPPADEAAAAPGTDAAPALAPSIVLDATSAEAAPAAPPKRARPAPAPIVAKSFSKFTVTVEYIELAPPAAPAAEAPAAPTP